MTQDSAARFTCHSPLHPNAWIDPRLLFFGFSFLLFRSYYVYLIVLLNLVNSFFQHVPFIYLPLSLRICETQPQINRCCAVLCCPVCLFSAWYSKLLGTLSGTCTPCGGCCLVRPEAICFSSWPPLRVHVQTTVTFWDFLVNLKFSVFCLFVSSLALSPLYHSMVLIRVSTQNRILMETSHILVETFLTWVLSPQWGLRQARKTGRNKKPKEGTHPNSA